MVIERSDDDDLSGAPLARRPARLVIPRPIDTAPAANRAGGVVCRSGPEALKAYLAVVPTGDPERSRKTIVKYHPPVSGTTLADVQRAIVDLSATMNARFGGHDARFESIDGRLAEMVVEQKKTNRTLEAAVRRLVQHDSRIKRLEKRVFAKPKRSR